jgi:hypothetical protein
MVTASTSPTARAPTSAASLTLQLLAFVAQQPRTYAETMEAWRSSCPRLSIWEDALDAGLVRVESSPRGSNESQVVLTARGRSLLDEA